MKQIHRELTKTEYHDLQKLPYEKQHEWLFPDGVPNAWAKGFLYFGHKIEKKHGHYFAVFAIGDDYKQT